MKKKNVTWMILVVLLFLTAIVLLLYPYIANYIFEHRADSIVSTVESSGESLEDEQRQAALEAAANYNSVIATGHVQLTDPFIAEELQDDAGDYLSLLNMTEDGVMGTVEIPSIDVKLPIYHGTSDDVLERGVGHLQGTSLPIGGACTHAVLSGHSGLSNAKLFTDLEELTEGDLFFLHVMGEDLAYEVDQIKVVLPTQLDDLSVVPGEDYCTLLTCTPYGVNSHRLLVRGHRVDYTEAVASPQAEAAHTESRWMSEYRRSLVLSLGTFSVLLFGLYVVRRIRGDRSRIVDDFC